MAINIIFLLQKGPFGFFATNDKIEDAIIQNVALLLQTRKGERICMPTYGVGLEDYLFEPNDNQKKMKLRIAIIQEVAKWEPRVHSIDPQIYYPEEIVMGHPLYGTVVFPDLNGMALINHITIIPPSGAFQIKKSFGLMINNRR